ncbi:MAG: hypothetical protein LH618_09510 [Saprospiraceae bacterium]|nr:hypothetical protein [Saprospiraceae bacterium]
MNKNLLLVGTVAVAGFLTLTAFGGKTLEQQQAEVKAAVDAKTATLRLEKQADCDSRVMAAAQTKYDEVLAARTAEVVTKGGTVKKGTRPKGPRVDPLPQPTKPTEDKTNRGRGDVIKPGQSNERGDVIKPGDNRRRGDVIKPSGCGN